MDELVHPPFPLHITNDSRTQVSTQTTQAIWKASQVQIINSGWWAIEGGTLYKTQSDKGRMHGIETNPYPLPNDDEEIVRLDELQFVIRGLFGPNILAPISRNPTAILDLGTGSGRYHPICTEAYYSWCFEVAEQFPDARVVGIDLSPVQPTAVPDNCEFIVADFTEGLEFDNGSLDLVHSRLHLPKSQY